MSRDDEEAGGPDGPLISIVIPCFNYARYVEQAINSALAQRHPCTEVIVVNDGSTDDSLAVIGKYADRVTVIDQKNAGHVASCNAGWRAARGAIVTFLDADDTLEPTALARVARVWKPGLAKVQFDLTIIDADGRDLGRRFCNFGHGYGPAEVRAAFTRTGTYRWPVTSGNAYARSFLERVFPLTVDQAPDGFLNTIAPLYGDVVTIPAALGSYRLHGANRSGKGSVRPRFPERIALRRRELRDLQTHAERAGVSLPAGDVLDRELTFLNYRLMSLKLGLDYPGRDRDSAAELLAKAAAALAGEAAPLSRRLAHGAWFLALSAAPRSVSAALVDLRFGRADLRKRLSAWVAGQRPRWAQTVEERP